jgi:hypothetical protein
MGPNFAPLLADLFSYSFEAEFVQKLLLDKNKQTQKKLALSLNNTYRYVVQSTIIILTIMCI